MSGSSRTACTCGKCQSVDTFQWHTVGSFVLLSIHSFFHSLTDQVEANYAQGDLDNDDTDYDGDDNGEVDDDGGHEDNHNDENDYGDNDQE